MYSFSRSDSSSLLFQNIIRSWSICATLDPITTYNASLFHIVQRNSRFSLSLARCSNCQLHLYRVLTRLINRGKVNNSGRNVVNSATCYLHRACVPVDPWLARNLSLTTKSTLKVYHLWKLYSVQSKLCLVRGICNWATTVKTGPRRCYPDDRVTILLFTMHTSAEQEWQRRYIGRGKKNLHLRIYIRCHFTPWMNKLTWRIN